MQKTRKEEIYIYNRPIEHVFNAAWECNSFRANVSNGPLANYPHYQPLPLKALTARQQTPLIE
jgi:hypothetical protein